MTPDARLIAATHVRLPPGEVDNAMSLFAERLLRDGEAQEDVLLALRACFGVSMSRAREALHQGARHTLRPR